MIFNITAYGLSIEKLAEHFFKAIISVQHKVSTLRQVHVIIFDIQNISKFLDAFNMCCQSYTPTSKGFFKRMSNFFGYGKSTFFVLNWYPSLFHYHQYINYGEFWFFFHMCTVIQPSSLILHCYLYIIISLIFTSPPKNVSSRCYM